MDAGHFDDLLRSLTIDVSRRGVFRAVTGFIACGALASTTSRETDARKNKKKKCGPCRKKKDGKCKKKRPNGTPCGAGRVCQDGSCVCPTEECGGACLPFCPLFQARNPLTCSCCTPNAQSGGPLLNCDPNNDDCCSENCQTLISVGSICVGRDPGQACDFDAQCASDGSVPNSCDGGVCVGS
jgi:hypothetical protein